MSRITKIRQIYKKYGITLNDFQLKEMNEMFQFLVEISVNNLKNRKRCKEQ
jgi:acetyl-CoA acetyltransferase